MSAHTAAGSILARLAARSEPQGECVVWTGKTNQQGYGRIKVAKKTWLVHRIAWTARHGPIPDGLIVRHKVCDNPPCWLDAHLALGTHADNSADMYARGRAPVPWPAKRDACSAGHPYPDNVRRNNRGHRICNICERASWLRRRGNTHKASTTPATTTVRPPAKPRIPTTRRGTPAAMIEAMSTPRRRRKTEPDYLDLAGVAQATGYTPTTLRHYKTRGTLPAPDITLGRTPGWRPATINAWMDGQPVPAPEQRDPGPVYLDASAAAARIGISPSTWRHYTYEGRTPPPDITLGKDGHGWLPTTIDEWHHARPGPGARTDLNPKEQA